MLGYNTRDGAASSNASEHFARLASALLIQAFCFDKDGTFLDMRGHGIVIWTRGNHLNEA